MEPERRVGCVDQAQLACQGAGAGRDVSVSSWGLANLDTRSGPSPGRLSDQASSVLSLSYRLWFSLTNGAV